MKEKPMGGYKAHAVVMDELVRKYGGLVNDITPAKPQPKKSERRIVGGSKASKILKGQR